MKIALTYNLKPIDVDFSHPDAELWAEYDTPETVGAIREAIKSNGYEVIDIEANEDAYEKLRQHRKEIDLVFNFSVAVTNTADRDAHMPMFCEILRIPYTGPGPLGAATILNKSRAKEVWRYNGIATPDFQLMHSANEELKKELQYPLIVKANEEGSSAGVRNDSVVINEEELRKQVGIIATKFGYPVLVETFLEGREFTVPVIGNGDDLKVFPIVEANFEALPEGTNKIDSYEAKWVWDDPEVVRKSMICPANIDEDTKKEIEEMVRKAFAVIGLRDWARFDLRMDKNNKLHILEVNCPVGLLPDADQGSKLPASARAAGISYNQLIGMIINAALKRYGK